ncbi:MAG: hypothetical protein EBU84_06100 [Actinobacteria bacterium]|nr:hypothetical protein [Actinomycetota bacterium]
MQPSGIMFHWTACIGLVQSLFLACVNPPTLMRAVYTGSALVNVYHYGLSAQLHEPSRQTMRLYVPDDEQRIILLARVAKWTSRGLHVVTIVMDVTYIALVTDYNIWLSMMMFVAVGFYPALKLLRRCAPEINTTVAQRLLNTNAETRKKQQQQQQQQQGIQGMYAHNETQYSLLDDSDHRDAVHQRFMLKQLPRMLAMIALGACHMALMQDVRSACVIMNSVTNSSHFAMNWMC